MIENNRLLFILIFLFVVFSCLIFMLVGIFFSMKNWKCDILKDGVLLLILMIDIKIVVVVERGGKLEFVVIIVILYLLVCFLLKFFLVFRVFDLEFIVKFKFLFWI